MSETISQLIRNTKEYSDVCDMCKDEILIYPTISGRTEYTQDEVEQITLKRIIDKLQAKEQECEKLSILAQEESARNGYVEYELNDKLKQKTQECENLKAEEKYLKQCCQKAGEELAKHSFEYDGKEKNLVVQAMELNEKYEKLKKALEEIEEIVNEPCVGDAQEDCKHCDNWCEHKDILDIINKVKGETNA